MSAGLTDVIHYLGFVGLIPIFCISATATTCDCLHSSTDVLEKIRRWFGRRGHTASCVVRVLSEAIQRRG